MNVKSLAGLGLVLTLLLGGCFFDEGPISFRTRKKRLDNEWKFNRVYENGVVVTPEFIGQTVKITNGHDVIFNIDGTPILWGKWVWHDHYDRIIFVLRDAAGDQNYVEWSIKDLRMKSLVAEEFTQGDLMRYELVPDE